jgi:hypothetical protein
MRVALVAAALLAAGDGLLACPPLLLPLSVAAVLLAAGNAVFYPTLVAPPRSMNSRSGSDGVRSGWGALYFGHDLRGGNGDDGDDGPGDGRSSAHR